MTTSWNDTQQIEAHLLGTADPGDRLLFDANLILDPSLADKLAWQQRTYSIITNYGRKQLKAEIEAVHNELFTAPEHLSFAQRIRKLFSKK